MDNLAYQIEDHRDEMLAGKIVAMSPRPSVNHNRAAGNIYRIFGNYLRGKTCEAFADGMDLYLTEQDRFVPDGMIVCNKDIIKNNGVHGAPDLVVEVLSTSTARNDRGHKKRLYEQCGVKEYWIVEPVNKSIEVYLLKDGKYELKDVYAVFPDYELNMMTKEERASVPTTFKTSLYDDLVITIAEVFEKVL